MIFLSAMLVATVPTAADVQAMEVSRVLEPLIDHSRAGRAYVEFAPTVETRNVSCVLLADKAADCTFETRVREFLAQDFGPWEVRTERFEWHQGRWHRRTSDLD